MSSLSRQEADHQGRLDNAGGGHEAELGEFLKTCAQDLNPSGSVRVLQRTPFRDERGRVSGAVLLGAIRSEAAPSFDASALPPRWRLPRCAWQSWPDHPGEPPPRV